MAKRFIISIDPSLAAGCADPLTQLPLLREQALGLAVSCSCRQVGLELSEKEVRGCLRLSLLIGPTTASFCLFLLFSNNIEQKNMHASVGLELGSWELKASMMTNRLWLPFMLK